MCKRCTRTKRGNVVRRLVVLPGFWTIQTSAHATLNEAISRALEAIDPYFRQGCVVRLDDEWGGDLGVKERKAIPLALLKGNDYWFCMGTDVDDALVAVHVCDSKGKCLENTAWQNGRFAAARILVLATGTYYIIVEVTSSPVERTHWAMLYGLKHCCPR